MILHQSLPHYPWIEPALARLPGVQPLPNLDFLRRDEVFAAQMALRDRLIAAEPDAVHGLLPQAHRAAAELFELVLAHLAQDGGYRRAAGQVTRPDGVTVALDLARPLQTLGRLVQEDLCILQDQGEAHHLTGAILCFPASWTLEQKLGRSMIDIHRPVHSYTGDMATRVQRMFHAIRPEQGLWRMNYLTYAVADLHHPLREETPRDRARNIEKPFVRCERQCLIRLPISRAVVFSIHSYVMRRADLPPQARDALLDHE